MNTVAAVVQLIPRARMSDPHEAVGWEYAAMRGTPYGMRRKLLLSPAGVPCTPPPFGALVAVDVARGTIAWRVPLGTPIALAPSRGTGEATVARAHDAAATPAAATDTRRARASGSPNLGGPIVTAAGLVFIGATLDQRLRAFDVADGRELWHAALPAGAKATPMTYAVRGRQYVAIAAGGDGDAFGRADEIVVFALPTAR